MRATHLTLIHLVYETGLQENHHLVYLILFLNNVSQTLLWMVSQCSTLYVCFRHIIKYYILWNHMLAYLDKSMLQPVLQVQAIKNKRIREVKNKLFCPLQRLINKHVTQQVLDNKFESSIQLIITIVSSRAAQYIKFLSR